MADIAIPGMIGPGDFTDDQRPKDWTQGMLDIDPNGDVILTYLLSVLPKVKTKRTRSPLQQKINVIVNHHVCLSLEVEAERKAEHLLTRVILV